MTKQLTLKEYIERIIKEDPTDLLFKHSGVLPKLLELEAIENYFIAILGIELDIKIKPIKRPGGRFYGKGVVEKLEKLDNWEERAF